ncbi:CPBP family intramembrane glutamic endopeptidase [Ligilactobacillus animalis]|uniref:CPBP family intramembrane glutamic endopeptidase n=1 Tax=Ligilactobacillus animalis TaxID=1605 RepID=UPI0002194190|nr:type II CAAX endopeptidase family protein [Ligilactobacillus animalis]KRM58283.1 CAAX family protease [Ligilactobacillus animalis KCTC 3501 = DSM 20602]MBU5278746.1 CPBP family intramembrane metalloprotease [Ligilactobacillus animalis]WKB73242.1 type II CAAX endopeptidase family protein [Ligilactobacillus animalis]
MKKQLQLNSLVILSIYCGTMTLAPLLWVIFKNAWYYPAVTVLNLIGCGTLLYLAHKFPFKDRFLRTPKKLALRQEIYYIIFGTLALVLLQWLSSYIEIKFLGQPSYSANTGYLLTVLAKYPYYLVNIVIFAPIMEEFVFRKVLFADLGSVIDPIGAALASSLLFSLAHQDGHYLTYAGIGLVLCLLYARTGRLRIPILAHSLMNLLIILSAW